MSEKENHRTEALYDASHVSDEIVAEAAMRADAARWDYVRRNLTRAHSPHMNGTFGYHFLTPRGRGESPEVVIDRLIEEEGGSKC
jgi:hypothetical protein